MGLFTRIFGKGDQERDQRAVEELEQIRSGQEHTIYPILKPGNWVGVQAGAIKQTLLGSPENPELVVGFGYDAPSNFVFLMPQDLEGKDPNEMLRQAYQNLKDYKQEFEVSAGLKGKVLLASGQDFSSEKILCRSHMLKAHELLQSDELLVSIPRRRCMMVCSRGADKELLNTFVALHNNAWQDDSYGNAPIINALFLVKEGEINGVLPLDKK